MENSDIFGCVHECPECGKLLTLADYEPGYDKETQEAVHWIWCSNCGYSERELQ